MKPAIRLLSVLIALLAVLTTVSRVYAAEFRSLGDVNGDGAFGTADAVLLQKYLLAEPDAVLAYPQAADFDGDGRLSAKDLTRMKRALLCQAEAASADLPECSAAAVLCAEDGLLLYSDRIDEQIAPASLTKLLTALTALQYLDPETVITVGTEQSLVKPHSSLCLIKPGHRLRLRDLLTGMLVASGNDAAYTVAAAAARAAYPSKSMSDSEAADCFAAMMNAFAAKLHMTHSHFVSPEGWDDPAQYTTAADLLTLAQRAYENPVIREIVGTAQTRIVFVSGENVTWKNTNLLLDPASSYYCAEAGGMKTGTTAQAGHCLIAAFRRNGKTYFTLAAGCRTGSARYVLTGQLLGKIPPLI